MNDTLSKLRRFNLIMGAFHLIQGLIMLFLATSVIPAKGHQPVPLV